MADCDNNERPACVPPNPFIPVPDPIPYRSQLGAVFTPLPPLCDQVKMAQAFQTEPAPSTLPPAVPNRNRPSGNTVCIEDVRYFIYDRKPSDNPLDLDLSFSDKDIAYAMRFTALRYNAIPPMVIQVHEDRLPFSETMLNGIAYYLYNAKTQQLMRNDVDYSAGNMTIDITKRRIESLTRLAEMFKQVFEKQAKDEKITINLNHGFMNVGGTGYWGGYGGAC